MDPVHYIFLNKGLRMSPGKLAAQAAHATALYVEWVYQGTIHQGGFPSGLEAREIYREWMDSGHYTKLTLEVADSEQMHTIDRYLQDRGFATFMVIDEGRTEINPFQPTALAVEVVDKADPRMETIFGEFKLYRESRKDKLLSK